MNDDLILSFGGSVKSLDDGQRFGGYGIIFSDALSPDLDNEFFNGDTQFWLEDRIKLPVLYGHAKDKSIGNERLGSVTFKQDETGIWFEGELEARSAYIKKIMELIRSGALGFSTAALGHLTERVTGPIATWIKRWPIFELSLTPTPAEPRTAAIMLKSYHPPSLDETIRTSKLSPNQLLREQSERIRRDVEQTLLEIEHPEMSVSRWADDQAKIRERNLARGEAQRDWLEMRDTARGKLAEADRALEEVEALEAELRKEYERKMALVRVPQFAPGSWPAWANR